MLSFISCVVFQTYFQPGIDHIVLNLQRKYNRSFPVIFSTYQAYLKDSLSRLETDIRRARKEGFKFAAKLVRGAYMVAERKRANELGITDPVQPDLKHTHTNYHSCLDLMFEVRDFLSLYSCLSVLMYDSTLLRILMSAKL